MEGVSNDWARDVVAGLDLRERLAFARATERLGLSTSAPHMLLALWNKMEPAALCAWLGALLAQDAQANAETVSAVLRALGPLLEDRAALDMQGVCAAIDEARGSEGIWHFNRTIARTMELRQTRWQQVGGVSRSGFALPALWAPVPHLRTVLLVGSPLSGKTTLGCRLQDSAPGKYAYFSSGEYWRRAATTRDVTDMEPDALLHEFLESTLLARCAELQGKTVLLDCYKRGAADLELIGRNWDWLLDLRHAVMLEIDENSLLKQCAPASGGPAVRVCRFWSSGKGCKFGAMCRFSHQQQGEVPRTRPARRNDEPEPQPRITAFFERLPALVSALGDAGVPLLSVSVDCRPDTSALVLCNALEAEPPRLGRPCLNEREREDVSMWLEALLDVGAPPEFSMPASFVFGRDAVAFVSWPERYVWTHKADGVRVWIVSRGGCCYVLNRRGAMWRNHDLDEAIGANNCVLDAEWMAESGTFLVFDVLAAQGSPCWMHALEERLRAFQPSASHARLLRHKRYHSMEELHLCLKSSETQAALLGADFAWDGLVFAARDNWYQFGYCELTWRWKDVALITADLEFASAGSPHLKALWECTFDRKARRWTPLKRRLDKLTPNAPALVKRMEDIIQSPEALSLRQLVIEVEAMQVQSKAFVAPLLAAHPLRTMPRDERWALISRLLQQGWVESSVDERSGLRTVCYAGKAGAPPEAKACRALVLDRDHELVACSAAQYAEEGCHDGDDARLVVASTKMDGSMVVFFRHHDELFVTSKRRMSSEQAQWARGYLESLQVKERLQPGWTYAAEAVYQDNLVQVPHCLNHVVLWGCWNERGVELTGAELAATARQLGLLCVPRFQGPMWHFVRHVQRAAQDRPTHTLRSEGFVLLLEDGSRRKAISPLYVAAQRVNYLVHPLSVWDHVRQCRGPPALVGWHHQRQWEALEQHVAADFSEMQGRISWALRDVLGELDDFPWLVLPWEESAAQVPVDRDDDDDLASAVQRFRDGLREALRKSHASAGKVAALFLRELRYVQGRARPLYVGLALLECCQQCAPQLATRLAVALVLEAEEAGQLVSLPDCFQALALQATASGVEHEAACVMALGLVCGHLTVATLLECGGLRGVRGVLQPPTLELFTRNPAACTAALALLWRWRDIVYGHGSSKAGSVAPAGVDESTLLRTAGRNRDVVAVRPAQMDPVWVPSLRASARMALLECVRPRSPYAAFGDAVLPVYRQTFAKGWAAQLALPETVQPLPRDCLLYVFLCTDVSTLAACRAVCRTWWMWIEAFEATTRWRQKKQQHQDALKLLEEKARKKDRGRRYGSRSPSPVRGPQ